jgi:hypothetical protein
MINSEVLIGTAEYLTLKTRCGINRCRYNRVQLYFIQVVYKRNISFPMFESRQG